MFLFVIPHPLHKNLRDILCAADANTLCRGSGSDPFSQFYCRQDLTGFCKTDPPYAGQFLRPAFSQVSDAIRTDRDQVWSQFQRRSILCAAPQKNCQDLRRRKIFFPGTQKFFPRSFLRWQLSHIHCSRFPLFLWIWKRYCFISHSLPYYTILSKYF